MFGSTVRQEKFGLMAGLLVTGVVLIAGCTQSTALQPASPTVTAVASPGAPRLATSTRAPVSPTPEAVSPTSTPRPVSPTPETVLPTSTPIPALPSPTQAPVPTATTPPPPPPSPSGSAGSAAEGEKTFYAVGCVGCHTVKGVGGRVGPELTSVGGRRDAAYIRQSIEDPTAYVVPGYQPVMPPACKMGLSAQDINNLVAFLTQLK